MDDGRRRPSHDTGCIVAGAFFFATFFVRTKKVDQHESASDSDDDATAIRNVTAAVVDYLR